MAVNNIDSTNILHQQEKSFVQEAEVDGIEIIVNMAKQGKIGLVVIVCMMVIPLPARMY